MWKKMTRAIGSIVLTLCIATTLACTHVSSDAVYGTYVATYPFGSDTLTLGRDGHFNQLIAVTGQGRQAFSGTWQYSQREGYIQFHHLGCVADGFGKLKGDWRTDVMEMSYQSVERSWFKLSINSGARFPYIKQGA
jgi:hypothetical protein